MVHDSPADAYAMNGAIPFVRALWLCCRLASFAPAALGFWLCGMGACRGDVTLPALISDNMVLQQHTKVNVWGKADPGESVTVELGPDSAQTTTGTDGSWGVKLDGLPSGGPYDMTVSGKNSIAVRNVAVGEVWVCGGEANMEYKVVAARNGQEEMADADLPMVRVFTVKHEAAETPQWDCEGSWVVCSPDTVKDFTAVGFFFAREMNREMHTPMGLIESAWGPSRAEAWTPEETLEKDATLHAALDRYEKAKADYPAALADYKRQLAERIGAPGAPTTRMPVAPLEPGGTREPAGLYNGMIAPLLRYPIRGVLWYQGESDTADPGYYGKVFPAMIEAWRRSWNEGEFPFLYAQLSGFLSRRAEPGESRWAELREAQTQALSTPRTGMAVTIDLGEEHEMHPADKQDVAHRLALLAENMVYGRTGVTAWGPMYAGMDIEGGKGVITFTHVDKGLVGGNGKGLKGVAIAGEDGRFVWAEAQIRGGKVVVQSPQAPKPVAVRYGWADFPDCDLYNAAGLPAGPFRTDGGKEGN
jgi:sialate O-acetylesterase